MHSRWLKTRRHFYESLKQEVLAITGDLSVDLNLYQTEYEKTFDSIWDVSSMEVFFNRALDSKLILAGDFHYFYQSQRTHLRVLRDLKKQLGISRRKDTKLILMLEIFNSKDQKHIDAYLQSQLSFEDLLKKTKWTKVWNNLPSKGYEVILSWAKKSKIKVYGINDSNLDDLQQRDLFSAELIDKIVMQSPNDICYVIYGDFHLAQKHLPNKLTSFDKNKDIILYLNSDKLYFALSEHAIEDEFDVLNLDFMYCILSSTPWVKLQSYLVYLQEMDDQMISEVEGDDCEPDYTDYLSKILYTFQSDFDLPDWSKFLDVLTPNDMAFETLSFLKLKKSEKEKLDYMVTAQKNIIFPKDKMQFLAKPSVNSAYSLVGEFIHAQISQRESLCWSEKNFMRKRIWIEAVSFFFNLWLNPRVKSLNEPDLIARLKGLESETQFENSEESSDYAEAVLKYAVDYRLSEIQKLQINQDEHLVTGAERWSVQLEAAGVLGKILGKRLYKNYKSGKINKETLINYLSVPVESAKFDAMYIHLVRQFGES